MMNVAFSEMRNMGIFYVGINIYYILLYYVIIGTGLFSARLK